MAPLANDMVRVFAHAGVGSLLPLRWNDVDRSNPQLDGWLEMGLVTLRGPNGEDPPEGSLRRPCCGSR